MLKPITQDDIVALATPPGIGAIAVIRVSGLELESLYKKVTRSKLAPKPRYSNYTTIYQPNNKPIDNCLITYFKKPNSFTGEDVIEISSHGGHFIPKAILGMLYREKVRQAAPGEFSYRAFINGKMDLIQAESISGIIASKTKINASVQLSNLNGFLSKSIARIKEETVHLLTILEHELDFSEEEINFTKKDEISSVLGLIYTKTANILNSSNFGKAINSGARVVLCGKPNAGKSSLFNRLSGSSRAIVTNIAGTTRDTIESWIEIAGIPVCIVDTAGITKTENPIESHGIRRTNTEIANSDILLVLDEQNPSKFYKQNRLENSNKDVILIHTKSDLFSPRDINKKHIKISVKKDSGISTLLTELSTLLKQNMSYDYSVDPVVVSERQKILLNKGLAVLGVAKEQINRDVDMVILSSLLREFIEHLEELLGKIGNDDIFNNLFSSFCVGK
ncbi:MAG: tRNA uridine-5-carboxymethylaminomethyl(34) synthesis GTPase MnmE [Candidatus Marinimicrobia bacterium]|nr:tRNA uridine-5-carboxymethylaminomethyl(34) synthesis GTPase MnmE [Candidatus Neomarinimicrobiota bacterium]|tara:strand:- start:1986 stop:3335 length:1350 start_codon:yes stop_codon:yes gene_type:complete